ncbi:hypothetical protein C7B82_05510 [Stenomitos frigidus ULC18]|uniref:Uncharacterized protein n=1 Tax=Stenomitos frigidus ULC18 TaxID=2107698 RepID=A0A2T1EID3_9CYAN|nr:hypothetical protein C7B82_05510 [Stenomitos frigidus ULC18]
MTTKLRVSDQLPDFVWPNHQNEQTALSQLTQPTLMDQRLGFLDGYPLILVFYRGFFCTRDRQQFQIQILTMAWIRLEDESAPMSGQLHRAVDHQFWSFVGLSGSNHSWN